MTKKVKRVFSQEFKEEAVELAKKNGVRKTAEELGVHESCIQRWKRDQEHPKKSSSISQQKNKKSYEELEKENNKLKKENGYLKEINKVLKKSTAIFSQDHMGGSK